MLGPSSPEPTGVFYEMRVAQLFVYCLTLLLSFIPGEFMNATLQIGNQYYIHAAPF